MSIVRTILLTWNPDKWPLPGDEWDWDELVERTAGGEAVPDTWSVGNRVRGIDPGDSVFLLRQGRRGRGLVATGVAESSPVKGEHWNRQGGVTSYVDVRWTRCLPLDARVDTEDLIHLVDGVPWNHIQSSGVEVREPDATRVAELWAAAVETHDRPVGS